MTELSSGEDTITIYIKQYSNTRSLLDFSALPGTQLLVDSPLGLLDFGVLQAAGRVTHATCGDRIVRNPKISQEGTKQTNINQKSWKCETASIFQSFGHQRISDGSFRFEGIAIRIFCNEKNAELRIIHVPLGAFGR